jgi:hypothetical protein
MHLHYDTVQITVAAVFAALAAVFATAFAAVAASSRRNVPFERVQAAAYRLRKGWLALLAVVLVCGLGVSFFFLP